MPERKTPDESRLIARLLLKSIESLPDRDRKKVLEYLVAQGLAGERGILRRPGMPDVPIAKSQLPLLRRQADISKEQLKRLVTSAQKMYVETKMSPEQQMVPVRFSQEQYEQFKSWCEDNGFSMAVVVRGLVERFLEEQGKRAS